MARQKFHTLAKVHWLFLLSSNWLFLSDSEWSILPDSNNILRIFLHKPTLVGIPPV